MNTKVMVVACGNEVTTLPEDWVKEPPMWLKDVVLATQHHDDGSWESAEVMSALLAAQGKYGPYCPVELKHMR